MFFYHKCHFSLFFPVFPFLPKNNELFLYSFFPGYRQTIMSCFSIPFLQDVGRQRVNMFRIMSVPSRQIWEMLGTHKKTQLLAQLATWQNLCSRGVMKGPCGDTTLWLTTCHMVSYGKLRHFMCPWHYLTNIAAFVQTSCKTEINLSQVA